MAGKRFLGFFALVLGLIGLVGCVGVAIAVWPVSDYLTSEATQVADGVEPVLKKASERLGEWESLLNEVHAKNNRIQSAANNVANLGAASDAADWKTMENVFVAASNALDKTEKIIHALELAISTIQNIDKLVTMIQLPGANKAAQKSAAENDPTTLDKIANQLKVVETAIQKIRSEKDPQKNAEKVARVTADFDELLTLVMNPVTRLKQRVTNIDNDVISLKSSISTWGSVGPIVATILFLWLGLGQWSLLVHGCSMMRSREGQSA